MTRRRFGFILFLCLSLILTAQEPADVIADALTELREDIKRDTQALNDLREEIATERTPLATRLETLRNTVAEQRQTAERLRRLRNQGEKAQADQEARARALEDEAAYLRSLFTEYSRAMDTRLPAARDPEFTSRLQEARQALTQDSTSLAPTVENLLDLSTTWSRTRLGGSRFQGSALDADGEVRSGSFATFGPVGFFAGDDPAGPAGLTRIEFGTDQPGIYSNLAPDALTAIRAVVKGDTASVPLDASGGDAIRVAEATPGILQQLEQGGFTMFPLAAVALAALFLAVWKTLELSRIRVRADAEVEAVVRALRQNDVETARAQATTIRRPLRRLVDDLIEYRDAPREHLEEIMHEHILAALPFLERNLGALAVLGGVAPLLGLLGTVTGMINTFRLVTLFGSGDAKLLAGGISEALVTTFTGLAIAIPTLLIHAALARRARSIIASLETMAATLVNDLKLRSTP